MLIRHSCKMCLHRSVSPTILYVLTLPLGANSEEELGSTRAQDLPQITVIGSQSSGKSSVLEVGRPLLARKLAHAFGAHRTLD